MNRACTDFQKTRRGIKCIEKKISKKELGLGKISNTIFFSKSPFAFIRL